MALGKRGRRVLQVVGFSILGLCLVWFSVPLWLPWVLRPLAGRVGASYGRYERLGYARFALEQFSLTNRTARIEARRVEALMPTLWLWRCVVARHPGPKPFLKARGWSYATLPSQQPGKGVSETGRDAVSLLGSLRRWAPVVVLSEGTIRSGGKTISVSELTWAKGELRAETKLPAPVGLGADLVNGPPFEVRLESEALRFQSALRIATNSAGLTVTGSGLWWSNRFELGAQFGPEGVLPVSAHIEAPGFRFPSQLIHLPEYGEISGSATARWEQGGFALDVQAAGRPESTVTNLPPLQVNVHAHGDTNAVAIQSVSVSSPWLEAELSRGLKVYFTAPFVRESAAFRLKADLARQPWYPLAGSLEGEAQFEPTNATFPSVRFRLAGSGIGSSSLKTRSVALGGRLTWPWLELSEIKAAFEDGSLLSVAGKMDLQNQLVKDGQLTFRGPLGRRWLPPDYSFDTAVFSGAFSGQLQQLNHSGELQISNGVTPYIQPLQLRAAWRGQSAIFSSVQAQVESTNLSLSAEGGGQIGSGKLQLELAALSLSTNQHPALTLTAPCRITAERHSNPPVGWALAISSLQLKGPGGEIHAQAGLNWPRQGQVELTMRNLPSTLFSEFSGQQALPFQLRELESFAVWTNAPMGFRLKLSADGLPPNIFRRGHRAGSTAPSGSLDAGAGAPATAGPSIPIRIQLEANGDRHGVAISNLVVTSQGSTVVNAHGFLPVTLNPASPTNLFQMERAQRVSFSAAVHPESFFWKELAAQTGLSLGEPQLTAGLSGTWPALQGRIELAARQIHLQTTHTNLPSLEQLHVSLLLDQDRVQLTRGQLRVQGQPVDLTGELPLAQGFWARVRDKPLPDWQKLRLQLRIPKAQFAAFQPLFPTLLAPQGDLSLELSVVPGLKLEGGLLVENARTRPLGSAGPLRDIRVQLRFQNRAVKLERASANLGGSALTVTGQADLSGTNWLHGALPPFVLSLQGLSVPLARDPEFILRSDLLLGIVKTNGAPPLISGTARLRDSFYLSDLQALVPGKVATPAGRPPYFSVEELWLADWRLALDVQGERFLKVRSPLFADEVSAKLKVIGTLKDPIALGDLKIDSGVVRFPFGALQVQQGLIVLASQDPYHPQITLNAASKQYGYEIRMEVTGPVDNPVIQFTSTPPLSSEQILLMVTAGQMPQGTFSLTPQQRAQTMALFLGRDLLTKLGFGDQAQQRLTIRSGEEISEQGRPTYHVEYKLTDRWSLEGEYDRFGDFNAGFKWRVYSK